MNKIAVVGLQYGDEGKGAIVDEVAQRSLKLLEDGEMVLVRRYQGGGNAGHTLVIGDEEYKLHLVPSGIINERTYNLIGKEVFTDPRRLTEEVKGLRARGIEVSSGNLGVASTSHVTLDYHVTHDQADFTTAVHASTGRGIKETAADQYGRLGIRFSEFLDEDIFLEALKWRFKNSPDSASMDFDRIVSSYTEARDYLAEFLVLEQAIDHDPRFAFGIAEGAQGAMLDVLSGPYPGTTSSSPSRVPKGYQGNVLGVMKFYDTSAGTRDRTFVGAMPESLQQKVRQPWGQFGTTTGKPRDVGWVNVVELRYAARETGARGIVATCGDQMELLAKLGEKVRAVEAVKIGGKTYTEWDPSFDIRGVLAGAEPVFKEFEPWERFRDDNGDLTDKAQRFADWIQEKVGVDILAYRFGPKRGEMVAIAPLLSGSKREELEGVSERLLSS